MAWCVLSLALSIAPARAGLGQCCLNPNLRIVLHKGEHFLDLRQRAIRAEAPPPTTSSRGLGRETASVGMREISACTSTTFAHILKICNSRSGLVPRLKIWAAGAK